MSLADRILTHLYAYIFVSYYLIDRYVVKFFICLIGTNRYRYKKIILYNFLFGLLLDRDFNNLCHA